MLAADKALFALSNIKENLKLAVSNFQMEVNNLFQNSVIIRYLVSILKQLYPILKSITLARRMRSLK
jgi:hypothetical protein